MSKPLSEAAQKILAAWAASENGIYLEGDPERLASALREAADGLSSATCAHTLYAIAAELEGAA
jgi:hypothetical protein